MAYCDTDTILTSGGVIFNSIKHTLAKGLVNFDGNLLVIQAFSKKIFLDANELKVFC
jgi:hypothetical protein